MGWLIPQAGQLFGLSGRGDPARAVENIIALGKSNGGGSDFRKVPTKILPRLEPHCRRILIAAQKATEAIPFWFILPMAAAGNFADCPSFHRLRKSYRPARQLSGQGLLKSSAHAAGRMRARPVSSSLTLRKCARLSVMMTSRVGRTWPSPRWPALALPCRGAQHNVDMKGGLASGVVRNVAD
jgi:hypothetical protein